MQPQSDFLNDFPWAKFRSTKSGVKIHVKYDVGESVPEYLFITNAEEHENNTLGKMNLKKGDIVTFDKGYNNYVQFSDFCDNGVHFVTRLKDNASYKVIKRRKTHTIKISSDHIIQFTGQVAKANAQMNSGVFGPLIMRLEAQLFYLRT